MPPHDERPEAAPTTRAEADKRSRVTALDDPGLPGFREDGTLPPYKGSFVKLHRSSAALSPYRISPVELVELLGTSPRRRALLRGLFQYRRELVRLDLRWATQWLGGSFTERDREPKDLDCATFALVPDDWFDANGIDAARVAPFADVLDSQVCQRRYGVDAHLALVNHLVPAMHAVHSWYALYGHTKDDQWKGFFELPIDLGSWAEDDRAIAWLDGWQDT